MTDDGGLGGSWLVGDWGTTNARFWRLDASGRVAARLEAPDLGVSKTLAAEGRARFEGEIRRRLDAQGLPAVLCGMVGSTLGWVNAPYVDAPANLDDLIGGAAHLDAGGPTFVAPGVRLASADGRFDVMRGEETQLFGWLAGEAAAADADRGPRLACHPGTHAKWVRIDQGRIVRFVTSMTGELFALLGAHSVLAWNGTAGATTAFDGAAFAEGLAAAGDGAALAARLFQARARVVAGGADPAASRDFVSGLLIGAEVAATPALAGAGPEEPATLIGDPELCRLYGIALTAAGRPWRAVDGEEAALAGLHEIAQRLGSSESRSRPRGK